MKRITWKSIVCALLIVVTLMAPMSASAASTAKIMKVNGNWVRVRDKDGDQIATVHKGTKVLYWGEKSGQMYKILMTNGKTGYIYKDYLTTYGAMKLSSVYVTKETTKLYKASGSNLRRSGSLAKGKYVCVYKTQGEWAYVKTMAGNSYFVQKDSIKKAF